MRRLRGKTLIMASKVAQEGARMEESPRPCCNKTSITRREPAEGEQGSHFSNPLLVQFLADRREREHGGNEKKKDR